MSTRLSATGARNDGDWVGAPTHLPGLDLHAGEWVHLSAVDSTTDRTAPGRALALLGGGLRLTSGQLGYAVDDQHWSPTAHTPRLWARLRRDVIAHAAGYLPVTPGEPVAEAVRRHAGIDHAAIGALLARHDLQRYADRRWGELAEGPRHQVALVVALAGSHPILLLDDLDRPSLIEHAAERVAAGALLVSAGGSSQPHPSARSVPLPDEGNR